MTAIPIVLVGYNRPASLARALRSIERANYPSGESIPLFINVDGGGPNGTADLAHSFDWKHGPKTVNIRPDRLGMRENSLRSGDLCAGKGAAIFVEDDTYLSPAFYDYCRQSFRALSGKPKVLAASLYSFRFCEFDQLRFEPALDGYDNYYMKSATTWGIMFLETEWFKFRKWMESFGQSALTLDDYIPEPITRWPSTSWKRYINKYLSLTSSYVFYPRASYANNYVDAGEHFSGDVNNFRVPIAPEVSGSKFSELSTSMARYDAFYEVESDCIFGTASDFDVRSVEIDLRQTKARSQFRQPLVLTTRRTSASIRKFGTAHLPLEENILYQVPGEGINLCDAHDVLQESQISEPQAVRYYHGDVGGRREILLIKDRALRQFGLRREN